jgi:hypothetical protein
MSFISFAFSSYMYNPLYRWDTQKACTESYRQIGRTLSIDKVYIGVLGRSNASYMIEFLAQECTILYQSPEKCKNHFHGGEKSQQLVIFIKKCQDAPTTAPAQNAEKTVKTPEATTLVNTVTEVPIAGPVATTDMPTF